MEKRMMKAAVLTGVQTVEIKQIPIPDLKAGEMEIKISACGVCGSDIHLWKAGKGWSKEEIPNFTMGHEFCGVVTNPGDSKFKVGDRVTFWANLYCGECDMCVIKDLNISVEPLMAPITLALSAMVLMLNIS